MIFQCACQDFPHWRIAVPRSSQKVQLFSPPVESPYHNLITYPTFSITKKSNCQNNSLSNFPPTASKNTPQAKFLTLLKYLVSQLLLTLFRWLHANEYIFAIYQITNSISKILWKFHKRLFYCICYLDDCLNFTSNLEKSTSNFT